MALPSAIVDLEDYTESINMIVYGDPGSGKTVLAGTCPNVLFISAENGTIAAKRQGSKGKVWRVKSWKDFEAAFDWVEKNPDVFDWIVVDSLTKVQQLALRWILDTEVAKNSKRDLDIPAIQDHQKWQNMLKRYVTMWNDLPVNVFWLAQAMHKEDSEGEDLVLPLILGKDYDISAQICAEMNVVAYLRVRPVKVRKGGVVRTERRRELLTESTPPYFAKDRYDVIGGDEGNMTAPTMPKIIALIAQPPKSLAKKATTASKTGTVKKAAPAKKATAARRATARA